MMLRWVVALLVVANLVFWAWSGGRLDALVGVRAQGDREPERIAQQVEPGAIRLLADPAGAPADGSASRPDAAAPAKNAGASAPAAASASRPSAASAAASAAGVRASAPLPAVVASAAARPLVSAASAVAATRPASATASASVPARGASAAAGPAGESRPPSAPASVPLVPRAPSAPAVLPPEPPASASSAAAVACLEAGPFGPGELTTVRTRLAEAVPPGRWSERRQETPGLWMIYMGPYADPEMLQKKKDEVTGIRVAFNEVSDLPGFASGLSLGRFDNRPAADAALARSVSQGIRTARVVMVRAPVIVHHLRVAAAEEPVAARLTSLRLGTAARNFRSC